VEECHDYDDGDVPAVPARTLGGSRGDRTAGAVAIDGDRGLRESGAAEPARAEGGWASSVVCLDGVADDLALVPAFAPAGSSVGETARLSGAACDQLSAGWVGRVVSDRVARVRGIAGLSQQVEGSGPGGLLDRIGRYRCHSTHLGYPRPTLRQHRRRGCR